MTVRQIKLPLVEEVAFELASTFMAWGEPMPEFGTRYPNVLESCLETPFQQFQGKYLYPELLDKAAILFYLMVKNHPFANGNKRMAVSTLLVFLLRNERWIKTSVTELYSFAKSVASSSAEDKEKVVRDIHGFIERNLEVNEN